MSRISSEDQSNSFFQRRLTSKSSFFSFNNSRVDHVDSNAIHHPQVRTRVRIPYHVNFNHLSRNCINVRQWFRRVFLPVSSRLLFPFFSAHASANQHRSTTRTNATTTRTFNPNPLKSRFSNRFANRRLFRHFQVRTSVHHGSKQRTVDRSRLTCTLTKVTNQCNSNFSVLSTFFRRTISSFVDHRLTVPIARRSNLSIVSVLRSVLREGCLQWRHARSLSRSDLANQWGKSTIFP